MSLQGGMPRVAKIGGETKKEENSKSHLGWCSSSNSSKEDVGKKTQHLALMALNNNDNSSSESEMES